MIFPGSCYAQTGTAVFTRPDGTSIPRLRLPLPGPNVVQGFYRRADGHRLDLVANAFLKDATAAWRLCDANNALIPDALAARPLIGIPLATG